MPPQTTLTLLHKKAKKKSLINFPNTQQRYYESNLKFWPNNRMKSNLLCCKNWSCCHMSWNRLASVPVIKKTEHSTNFQENHIFIGIIHNRGKCLHFSPQKPGGIVLKNFHDRKVFSAVWSAATINHFLWDLIITRKKNHLSKSHY